MSRIEPDKQSYGLSMAQFFQNLIPDEPRSPATSKLALTTSASRTYTREYGVECNILMTKLYGEERTRFGFDKTPARRHFALKIYEKVYEFGPYPELIRKSLFSNWCDEHPGFEFASVMETNFETLPPVQYARAISAYTMTSEDEWDKVIQKYRIKCARSHYLYHPEKLSCFAFAKFAVMELVPEALPEDEMELWLAKCLAMMNPEMRKTVRFLRRRMHEYAGNYATGKVLEEIQLDLDENNDQISSRKKSGSCKRPNSSSISIPNYPNPKNAKVDSETCTSKVVVEIDLTSSDDEN